jgi:hypothetical protein
MIAGGAETPSSPKRLDIPPSPLGRTGLGWWPGREFKIGPTVAYYPAPSPLLLGGECLRLLHEEGARHGGERCPLGRRIVGRAQAGTGGHGH